MSANLHVPDMVLLRHAQAPVTRQFFTLRRGFEMGPF